MSEAFPLLKVSDIEDTEANCEWLVSRLWAANAAGIIGGEPKSGKTWLGLDIAISVASGTPCLGEFEVPEAGNVLIYLAEDSLTQLKKRLAGIAKCRGLNLADLPLFTLTVPRLQVDRDGDQERLRATMEQHKPKLLLLDPFVRISSADENSSNEISKVLGYLRELQRDFHSSVIVVHHSRKPRSDGSKQQGGRELRGSGDFYAWADSLLTLQKSDRGTLIEVQHRTARPPEDFYVKLVDDDPGPRLEIVSSTAEQNSLKDRILDVLRGSEQPMKVDEIRAKIGGNNVAIRRALTDLMECSAISREKGSYRAVDPGM